EKANTAHWLSRFSWTTISRRANQSPASVAPESESENARPDSGRSDERPAPRRDRSGIESCRNEFVVARLLYAQDRQRFGCGRASYPSSPSFPKKDLDFATKARTLSPSRGDVLSRLQTESYSPLPSLR